MNWKEQLRLSLNQEYIKEIFPNCENFNNFPIQITPHYYHLLDSGDNPLQKIVFPTNEEESFANGDLDAMEESKDYRVQGLQHRYLDTVLLVVSDICASHCRFCFRKRIFDPDIIESEVIENLESAILYIKSHKEISNVLLSGGDPFINSNNKILSILNSIANIDHINYIRIGTKILAYLPQRIIEEKDFVNKLAEINRKKPIYLVVHFDHSKEFSPETVKAIKMLNNSGLKLLSQTTLLKGVNDNSENLFSLFSTITKHNIIPYYIFQTMPTSGVSHYQVKMLDAFRLLTNSSSTLSGIEKSYKYIIPHNLGKIEGLGFDDNFFYFKFHRSRDISKNNKLFKIPMKEERMWFSESEIIYI